MSRIVTLYSDSLQVSISTFGAEIISVKKNGVERIWQGAEGVWSGHAPILFPFCGRLVNTQYKIGGKVVENVPIHGYAKRSEFEVVSEEKTSVSLLLKSSEETKKIYPFNVDFRVFFKLDGDSLKVYYIVENNGETKAYFSVGCHEAFSLNGNFEDYSIEFDSDKEFITSTGLKSNMLSNYRYNLELKNGALPLSHNLFSDDEVEREGGVYATGSIVIENIKSKRVNLLKNGSAVLSLYFNDFSNLVLWTEKGASFIAIEPWNGLPDVIDTNGDIETKKGILTIEPNDTKTYYHSITFED
ncbi:MAG: aldose 1-epimerase family protein [Clostridia bacterium]|nr:aldose 1-epimerase family protein [Clostridia bacterium]